MSNKDEILERILDIKLAAPENSLASVEGTSLGTITSSEDATPPIPERNSLPSHEDTDTGIGGPEENSLAQHATNDNTPPEPEPKEVTEKSNEPSFYVDAKKYWSTIEPTVDGMLGGFGSISYRDIKGSTSFLKEMFKMRPPVGRRTAVDCGAGIGRVTKSLLFPLFQTVDMVEQDENFANSAREYLGPGATQLGTIYNIGLQNFQPETGKYDVIWCQWVLGHLTDGDLIQFFERAAQGLSKNGMIIIKENVTSSGNVEVDETDSSMTRPLKKFQEIIQRANLRIIKTHRQTDLPKGLYPIYMIALRPMKRS